MIFGGDGTYTKIGDMLYENKNGSSKSLHSFGKSHFMSDGRRGYDIGDTMSVIGDKTITIIDNTLYCGNKTYYLIGSTLSGNHKSWYNVESMQDAKKLVMMDN